MEMKNGNFYIGGIAVSELAEKYGIQVLIQKQFKELRKYGFEITKDIESRKADFILLKDKKAVYICIENKLSR